MVEFIVGVTTRNCGLGGVVTIGKSAPGASGDTGGWSQQGLRLRPTGERVDDRASRGCSLLGRKVCIIHYGTHKRS